MLASTKSSPRGRLVSLRSAMRTVFLAMVLPAFLPSCGPLIGFVSPDETEYRFLELWNRSKGYVVFRVSAPDGDPLVTSALPPGGEFNGEIAELFGTLCADVLKIEIFAFARANPQQSALEDETLVPTPFASAVVELLPGADYGCRADVHLITLGSTIYCDVLEIDESAPAIGFDANGSVQRQQGLKADDPPIPQQPERFALTGRVVNLQAQPVPNVEIQVLDLDESVFTDSEGRFEIQRPNGSYMLEAIVPDVQVTPGARRYAHREQGDLPIEFLALTDVIPQLSASQE